MDDDDATRPLDGADEAPSFEPARLVDSELVEPVSATPETSRRDDDDARKPRRAWNGGADLTAYQFPKGVSGNPGGSPKRKPITATYERLLSMSRTELASFKPRNGVEKLAWSVITRAWNQNGPGGTTPAFAREVTDRVEGTAYAATASRTAVTVNVASSEAVLESIWAERKRRALASGGPDDDDGPDGSGDGEGGPPGPEPLR